MTNHLPDAVQAVVDEAAAMMTVSTADSSSYDIDRQVMNARFDRRPTIIAFCKNTDHVSFWFCQANEVPELGAMSFVIRSGGHQHEGRSADGTDSERIVNSVVLDVSHFAEIGDIADDDTIWIESGAALGDVIKVLDRKGYVLPVGGCGSVRAGGLTHGGGWGLSWRNIGMTIDQLIGAEIVTPDGTCRTLSQDSTGLEHELFWAIRGGGGGNFGVVTRLHFKLEPQQEFVDFRLTWNSVDRLTAVSTWTDLLASHDANKDRRLDGFARMSAIAPDSEESPAMIGGWFRGTKAELEGVLATLVEVGEGADLVIVERTLRPAYALLSGSLDDDERASMLADDPDFDPAFWAMQLGAPNADGASLSTCEFTPQRHKVSSAYPASSPGVDQLRDLADFFDDEAARSIPGANLYASIHAMGGAAGDNETDTAYSWRDRPFLVQVQAWWTDPRSDDACLSWVRSAADAIASESDGAFISFPDEAQTLDVYYDRTTLGRLRELKETVDPAARLRFPLSLAPPAND